MVIDLQQSVNLHTSLKTQLQQTENLVANLANALKPYKPLNLDEINQLLGAIAINNRSLSTILLNLSAKLLEFGKGGTDPAVKTELLLALRNSNQIRSWIAHWPQIINLIQMQIPAKRRKLFHNNNANNDIRLSQLSAYDKTFDDLHKILNAASQDEGASDYGCFADISLPNSVFLENIHAAYRLLLVQGKAEQSHFIDVGCGSGFKVLQASNYFEQAVGLEYDEGYANVARNILERAQIGNGKVITGDGITFEHYQDYNVVYLYRPMRDTDQLKKLENQIANSVAPGTILVAPYFHFLNRYQELDCVPMGGSLYLAKSSPSQAQALRRQAELTGTNYKKLHIPVASIWDPILKVSHQKGYGLQN